MEVGNIVVSVSKAIGGSEVAKVPVLELLDFH
jgi:hypothetical protein